eukprot:6173789-Pleurochrysis_carterae.AAC.1
MRVSISRGMCACARTHRDVIWHMHMWQNEQGSARKAACAEACMHALATVGVYVCAQQRMVARVDAQAREGAGRA